MKYIDPDGEADQHYIIEINTGNVTFINKEGNSFTVSNVDNINIRVSDADRIGMNIVLPPKSTISILANTGNGKFTIANPKDTERTIDLGGTIDSYNDYQLTLENKYKQLQNSIKHDVDSAWSFLGDFIASYFGGVFSYGLGADPASLIGEGLASNGNPIESIQGIFDSLQRANKTSSASRMIEVEYNKQIWVNLE
ncbi:MAG: hypothetical protein LBQ14_08070 [Treponema sp.]|nr:hypothetical protein [Treponema sp.]